VWGTLGESTSGLIFHFDGGSKERAGKERKNETGRKGISPRPSSSSPGPNFKSVFSQNSKGKWKVVEEIEGVAGALKRGEDLWKGETQSRKEEKNHEGKKIGRRSI